MTAAYPSASSCSLVRFRVLCVLTATLLLGGCASLPDDYRDPRDPWEAYNRGMHQFNTDFDTAFLKPLAKGYKAVTPDPVDKGITNFFNNLADVTSLVNNLLQVKLSRAASDAGRLVVNSTVGLLGFVDVASNLGLPSYKEDFGQTLGYWGAAPGPYFVLPILGPSTVRETFGLAGDIYTDPLFNLSDNKVYWGLAALRLVDRRADFLTATKVMEEAALDPYIFVRDAYLQRRRNLVYDGNPPTEDYDELWYPGVPEAETGTP
jgi:phospholipid-binding lipoprotein MlaA